MICRLAAAPNHLAFVETIAPEAEPEPKYDAKIMFSPCSRETEGKTAWARPPQFKWPHGLAVDSAGNVFVADRGNHLVRKIRRDGIVTTLAGSRESMEEWMEPVRQHALVSDRHGGGRLG